MVTFDEALAWCTAQRSKCLAAVGDLNGRTRSETAPSACLNGTDYEVSSLGIFTSHRLGGEGMVDYALFSSDFLAWLEPGDLQVIPIPPE
jgi:hypothetical protein